MKTPRLTLPGRVQDMPAFYREVSAWWREADPERRSGSHSAAIAALEYAADSLDRVFAKEAREKEDS